MRTPANTTKQFMNQLVGTLNVFFKKVSKNEIQFQLPEQFAFPKKSQNSGKTKAVQKESKQKSEENAERMKIFKRAFKRYRDQMLKNEEMMSRHKDSSQKEKIKFLKNQWKGTTDSEKFKWVAQDKKKKDMCQRKLRAKNPQGKTGKSIHKENHQNNE